uniref:Ras-GEF domain-containing protein n=1 Tax=Macrostomum lignano TaxID=282301 RepID=A0A1I8GN39_9PLAT
CILAAVKTLLENESDFGAITVIRALRLSEPPNGVFTGAADDVTTAARLLHGIASGVKKLSSNLYHRKTVSAFLIPRIDAVYAQLGRVSRQQDNRYHLNDDARQQKYTELFLTVEEYDLVRNRLLELVNMIEKHSWSDLPTEGTWSDIARLVNQTNSPRGRWRDFIMPISRELAFLGTAIFHSNRVLPWIYLCRHHLEDALKNKGSSMDTVITRLPPSEVPHKQGSRGRGATLLSPRRLCQSFILWCEKFVTPALEDLDVQVPDEMQYIFPTSNGTARVT